MYIVDIFWTSHLKNPRDIIFIENEKNMLEDIYLTHTHKWSQHNHI